MKRKYFSVQIMALFLVAMFLIAAGIACIWNVVSEYEEMVYWHVDHAALLVWMHGATIRLALGGAMIALGAGMMFIETYLSMKRTLSYEKEAKLLREKK